MTHTSEQKAHMIHKFVSIGTLAAACLLSPAHPFAGTPERSAGHAAGAAGAEASDAGAAAATSTASTAKSTSQGDPVGDKFRKLQREMEGAASKRTGADADAPAKTGVAESEKAPESQSIASLAFQIILGLIFVLILAVVTIRILKRLQGRMLSKPGKGGGDLFEVLESCHLGTNQKVVAMRMNEEVGILGVTPQGITLLTILKEPASEIRLAHSRESNSAAFSDNLNKLLDRFKKPKRVSDLLDEAQG